MSSASSEVFGTLDSDTRNTESMPPRDAGGGPDELVTLPASHRGDPTQDGTLFVRPSSMLHTLPLRCQSSHDTLPRVPSRSESQRQIARINETARFEVRRRIGSGGMGVVYEAFDRERNEAVALKTLHCRDERMLRQFKREFRRMQGVEHPNVVSLGELFEVDQQWFFSMELIDGVDLLSYVRPEGRLNEARLRRALAGLASGIAAIHAVGKVHRDIKPKNVLVTRDEHVVLLDFGLVTDVTIEDRSTGELIAGTATYMAPEHTSLSKLGPPADWYSFGVVLYEALTGRLPHTGKTTFEILMAKQFSAAEPPRTWSPHAPADLSALCVDLLAADAADRPTGDQVCARLGAGPVRRQRSATPEPTFCDPEVFVGRDAELALLEQRFADARERPMMVVVEGESGLGKSRLVERFADMLREDRSDAIVLSGHCYERETVSYKAFDGIADALARYMSHLRPEQAAALLPTEAGLLPRLFQAFERVEAIARAPLEPEYDDPHEQQRRMFDALRELLVRLCKRHPTVLIIDDLQWTDPDSLHLLHSLLSPADAPCALVLATSRPVEQSSRRRELSRLYELTAATRIELAELSERHAVELARSLLRDPPPQLAWEIARESGGHPQFVQELALAGGERDGRSRASLDDTLWSRIVALPRAARVVLEALCVAGRPASQDTVANAVGIEFGELSTRVALLRAARLVRTNGVGRTDAVVCYHDRIRELVVRKLDDQRRRRWHARLAGALERTGAARTDPHALVHHAEAAGDPQRAAQYARAAARDAVEATAFDKAAELYAIALRLARFERAADRRAAQLQLAHALGGAGRGPEAATMFEMAAEGADHATRMDCRRRAAEQWLVSGHIRRGLDAVSASLDEIGESMQKSPRRALASLLGSRLRLWLRGPRWNERAESEIAPAALTRLDVLQTVAHNLATVDTIRGADYNARFLRLALDTGEPTRVAFALATEAGFVASQGLRSGPRARRLLDEIRRIAAHRPENLLLEAWTNAADGWISHLQGQFRPAEQSLRRASALLERVGAGTFERNNCSLWRAYALCQLGDLNELRAAYPRYLYDAQQRGDRFIETSLRRAVGRFVLLSANDVTGAREDLRRATWDPPEGAFHVQHWSELESLCDIALYEGTVDHHAASLEPQFELLARSMLSRIQIVRARATWTRARLALASGDRSRRAAEHAHRLASRLRRERCVYAAVMADLVDGAVAMRDGGRGRDWAIAHLHRAVTAAEAADMSLHRAAAQRRLAALIGGTAGGALRAESDRWMHEQAVVAPERWTQVIAPGFAVEPG